MMNQNATWKDGEANYCAGLVSRKGDSKVIHKHVPAYLRYQSKAARKDGLNELADVLSHAATLYEQKDFALAYVRLLQAVAPPAKPKRLGR